MARHTLRQKLEAAVERAIAALDMLDGDENLEDNGDLEPSFGTALYHYGRFELELEGDSADEEPSLGWAENISQAVRFLAAGTDPDLPAALRFTGHGSREANVMLRARRLPTVRLPIGRGE